MISRKNSTYSSSRSVILFEIVLTRFSIRLIPSKWSSTWPSSWQRPIKPFNVILSTKRPFKSCQQNNELLGKEKSQISISWWLNYTWKSQKSLDISEIFCLRFYVKSKSTILTVSKSLENLQNPTSSDFKFS